MAGNPVLVVGAGPTGLMLAIELARRDIPFRLIDRHPEPLCWDRATVLKTRTLEVFDSLALADEFVERGAVVRSVVLFAEGEQSPPIAFDHIESRFPFMLSIPEHETESILTRKLEEMGGVVERGVQLVDLQQGDSSVAVRLRAVVDGTDDDGEACWVVGTDGLHSAVRTAMDDPFEGHDNPSHWAVVDAYLDGWEHPGNAIAAQMESPAVNPIPLRDGHWRIYIRPDAEAGDLVDKVNVGLAAMSPGASMRDPDEPRYFHTQSRVAHQYRMGRTLLAGDAAHACSPIQGHGMNIGIQDANNLGWKLALVVRGDAPEGLLDTYEAERQPVARAVVQSGDEAESRAHAALHDPELRRSTMARLQADDMRRGIALEETEIAHRYDANPAIGACDADGTPEGAIPVGARVGDVGNLQSREGVSRLHELTRTPGHDLFVLLGEADGTAINQALDLGRQVAERYQPHLKVHVVSRNALDGVLPSGVLCDSGGALHRCLADGGPSLALVRPDGYLGYRGRLSLDALDAHLGNVFTMR